MQFTKCVIASFVLLSSIANTFADDVNNPLAAFRPDPAWTTASAVSAVGNKLQINTTSTTSTMIIVNSGEGNKNKHLVAKDYLGDTLLSMEYLLPQDATAKVYLMGRYAIELTSKNNEWQRLSAKLRAPRFNESEQKLNFAFLLEVRINEVIVSTNKIFESYSQDPLENWEKNVGATSILANHGLFAFRHFTLEPADFGDLTPPEKSGGKTNEAELIDFVALGKTTFAASGCSVCHSIEKNDTAASTGPNLFGLFTREPRARTIVEGSEGHRFTIKANAEYLRRSLRNPTEQVAIGESGAKKDTAYPAIMPPFNTEVMSDLQINAIGAYLATRNEPFNQGPAIKLIKKGAAVPYNPIADKFQFLVDDQVRIQRGPMVSDMVSDVANGMSAAAIHVGLVNGINYSFDPRILAIAKIWQGGFLNMEGEFVSRGGEGLQMGYDSHDITLGDTPYLLAPLNHAGKLIDFSFKNAKYGDYETIKKSLYNPQDHLDQLAAINAQFLGYSRNSKNKEEAPYFRYRVGQNIIAMQTSINAQGKVSIRIEGELKTAQRFALHPSLLQTPSTNLGQLQGATWTLPAGNINARLQATIAVANNPWHAAKSAFDYRKQTLKTIPTTAHLPAGYRIENYYSPTDNFGREQLFEALGLVATEDGTIVVATRTAGIWRLVKGEWQLFAEGAFETLGVVAEDKKGLTLIAGQKAELTRITDTNGDGIADNYETLFDAHSYHGNYHSYLHGPVRGADGAYYININLADTHGAQWGHGAGGKYMGSSGGFGGWNIRIEPNGKFTPWANGLRSPAGLGVSPDGRLWYSENQGEFVGTSKIFVLEKDKFYGHPASLVDLPGMTPNSPEIRWEKYASKRALPAILLPHNRVANSPGNLVWDTSNGKFGPYAGQLLVGDQAQSNLLRVTTEWVAGIEQGCVMPFIDGLESGVMRPVMLRDGSLLLGQTGRGWAAVGGHVASLQRIVWDGKTIAPAIHTVQVTTNGFNISLTQPLVNTVTADSLKSLLTIASWVYRDAADYGSDELGAAQEAIANVTLSDDRKKIIIVLENREHPSVHPQQTARVYHLSLNTQALFKAASPTQLDAYYTLYNFATAQ